MKFAESLENFTSPVIAVDSEMFVAAKNYLASMTFPNIHVGAKIEKYTDIDLSKEVLFKGTFYGKTYTYFTCFTEIEGKQYTLIFISLSTFKEDLLPFDPISLYKEKVAMLPTDNNELKNKKRQYIRSVHNNLIKASYFENFVGLFNSNKSSDKSEMTELKKACFALGIITNNYLENIKINLKIDSVMPSLIANVGEVDLTALLINSLFFAVLNSNDDIQIELCYDNKYANIAIEFQSNFDFFELYNNKEVDNESINSAFSLSIAMELAKRNNIGYKISRNKENNKVHYTISHYIPVELQSSLTLSSKDTLGHIMEKLIVNVFFGESL